MNAVNDLGNILPLIQISKLEDKALEDANKLAATPRTGLNTNFRQANPSHEV